MCSLCLYLPESARPEGTGMADAVINGQSVCVEHAGYITSGSHARALALLVEQSGFDSLTAMQEAHR